MDVCKCSHEWEFQNSQKCSVSGYNGTSAHYIKYYKCRKCGKVDYETPFRESGIVQKDLMK